VVHKRRSRDPSLRLKNGYAQDDAIGERKRHQKFKLHHYQVFREKAFDGKDRKESPRRTR